MDDTLYGNVVRAAKSRDPLSASWLVSEAIQPGAATAGAPLESADNSGSSPTSGFRAWRRQSSSPAALGKWTAGVTRRWDEALCARASGKGGIDDPLRPKDRSQRNRLFCGARRGRRAWAPARMLIDIRALVQGMRGCVKVCPRGRKGWVVDERPQAAGPRKRKRERKRLGGGRRQGRRHDALEYFGAPQQDSHRCSKRSAHIRMSCARSSASHLMSGGWSSCRKWLWR